MRLSPPSGIRLAGLMVKILVIDDDRVVCDALLAFLSRSGREVFVAGDGLNGLQMFKSLKPDLVILDRDLPAMSGSRVLDAIRKITARVPVLVLSGYDAPEEVGAYLKRGAATFLAKSAGLSAVLDEVDRLLGAGPGKRGPEEAPPVPAKDKPAVAAAPAAAPGGQAGIKPRILIAEDDPEMRRLLTRFVERNGWEPVVACDGIEAEDLAAAERPDILLLDIFMPGKSGAEVLRAAAAALPRSGVIMVTGNDDEALARKCLEQGAFDYVSKPINLNKLAELIRTRLLLQS